MWYSIGMPLARQQSSAFASLILFVHLTNVDCSSALRIAVKCMACTGDLIVKLIVAGSCQHRNALMCKAELYRSIYHSSRRKLRYSTVILFSGKEGDVGQMILSSLQF